MPQYRQAEWTLSMEKLSQDHDKEIALWISGKPTRYMGVCTHPNGWDKIYPELHPPLRPHILPPGSVDEKGQYIPPTLEEALSHAAPIVTRQDPLFVHRNWAPYHFSLGHDEGESRRRRRRATAHRNLLLTGVVLGFGVDQQQFAVDGRPADLDWCCNPHDSSRPDFAKTTLRTPLVLYQGQELSCLSPEGQIGCWWTAFTFRVQ